MMKLSMRRIILYVRDVPALAAFYRDVIGLPVLGDPDDSGWVELDAGGIRLALHNGGAPREWKNAPRLVFAADDVAAARAMLIGRGASMGSLKIFGALHLCDGKDPEGNIFQISNRP